MFDDNECPKDSNNNNILIVYKDNSSSNSNFSRLVCSGCLDSEDGYIYWLVPNNTSTGENIFPQSVSGIDEGEDITQELDNDIYKHTRELNISSTDYIGKEFSCVSMTESGTVFYQITS
ncbi:putative interleukin binding protein [Finch poxvirus]|uniref:Interleukin binding protein n=2 Tax=unclassified Avipoxvirus TaxID=336487 RepID=A0AAT9US23_9POXV|nr:putative interleukin binding protein [Finch poxvirus]UOX39032.1 putative interleukin binding protein [Finch poxvirus]